MGTVKNRSKKNVKAAFPRSLQGHFLEAFRDTLPASFAYVPLGAVFGLLFHNLGLPWYLAPLMSFCLAGSSSVQFLAVAGLMTQAPLVSLFITILCISFRNSFYGIHLIDRYQTGFWRKNYLIIGLIDSTYSIILNRKQEENETPYLLSVTGLIHFYWVVGTFLGAYFATDALCIPGLEFSLAALFTVFFIEQWKKRKDYGLVATCSLGYLIGYLLVPQQAFIIGLVAALCYPLLVARSVKEVA